MGFILFLIIGIFVGWAAGMLVKGHGFGGIVDLIVGVIGSVLGGFIFDLFGVVTYGLWGSIATSVIGAIVFLGVLALFKGSSANKKAIF